MDLAHGINSHKKSSSPSSASKSTVGIPFFVGGRLYR